MQTGLKGENMNVVYPSGISSTDWVEGSLTAVKQQPLTWYKVSLFPGVLVKHEDDAELLIFIRRAEISAMQYYVLVIPFGTFRLILRHQKGMNPWHWT